MRSDIYIYAPNEEDLSGVGICGSLVPSSCTFEELENGMSELTMVHPIDAQGRYKWLQNDYILSAYVPVRNVHEIVNGQYVTSVEKYTVKSSATKAERYIYSKVSGGKKVRLTAAGDAVNVVEKPESQSRWRVTFGKYKGFIASSALDYESTSTVPATAEGMESVTPSWYSKPQLFRIYNVDIDDSGAINVQAKHITYDLMYNLTSYVNAGSVTLQNALNSVLNNCINPHDFKGYTNIQGTHVSCIYRDKDAITAILDPDAGIASTWNAEVVRDNFDIYLLDRAGYDRGTTIEYRKNLAGIRYTVSYADLCTQIKPIGENSNGTPLYLPEVVIDSPKINDYAVKRAYTYQCNDCTVGKNGVTADIAYARMREQVQQQYDNGVDEPAVTVDVDFAYIGNDPKYSQFRDCDKLYLYDTVHIRHDLLGINITGKVTGVTWDVLRQCVTNMTLGTVKNVTAKWSAWQTANGAALAKNASDMINGASYNGTSKSMPSAAMTAATSQGCTASASSVYNNSYPAWKAFDNNKATWWASAITSAEQWIQLNMQTALSYINIDVYSRAVTAGSQRNPISGRVLGSNNGSNWNVIGKFDSWNSSANDGSIVGTVSCSNAEPMKYVRLVIETRTSAPAASNYVAIGDIKINGYV